MLSIQATKDQQKLPHFIKNYLLSFLSISAMVRRIDLPDLSDDNRLVADDCVNLYRLDEETVVKLCSPHRLAEAHAMQFVQANILVPVPKMYDAYIDDPTSRGVIVMEYIKGNVLADVWDTLSRQERSNIIAQLRDFMDELRFIKDDFIGSVYRTPCHDPVSCDDFEGSGYYNTEKEFNEGLICAR